MQDTVQLFTAKNGQLSAKVVFANSTFRHIHSLVNPSVEGVFFENIEFWGDIILFVGTGLGYHIAPFASRLPSRAVVIAIDFYDALIDHCRKSIFSGLPVQVIYLSAVNVDEASASAAALMGERPNPKIQVIKHPASFDMHRQFYEAILDRIIAIPTQTSPAQAPTRPRAKGHKAFLMYGNFFLEQEIAGALRANSIETELFPYNKHQSPLDYENALLRRFQENRPSIILSVNMKGIDGGGVFEDAARRLGIPVVVWFVDDPRRIVFRQAGNQGFIAACWEKAYLPWLEKAGFSKVVYLPLATDPTLFRASSETTPSVQLGFVGTSMVDAFAGKIKERFLWSDSLAPLVEEMSQKLLVNPFYDVDKEVADYARQHFLTLPFSDAKNISWLCAYSIHTASMKKRKQIIGGLLSEGIETFGDEAGWKYLVGPSITTHPDVDYRHKLRDVYRDIRINVNVTSCQMPAAVNQRVFDIPCAGSFVVSDAQKDLYDLFDVGKEAIVYENLDDLKEKIRFYTTHEEERRMIINAAQKRILNEHTYEKRINDLFRFIEQ